LGSVARVVLAMEAYEVAEEVMHFLDRSGCARVVATAVDDRQLAEAVRQMEPDAVIAQPALVTSATMRGPILLALETHESIAALRSAVAAGARGFFVWPADREQLASAAGACVSAPAPGVRRATVIGVHSSRGGAGATFVATHLAAALSRAGRDCILIDADPVFADVTAALGAPSEGVHTFGDLLPLAGELTAEHLRDALWAHASGMRVLLSPTPQEAASVTAADLRGVVQVAASTADAVVVHLPRALGELARAGVEASDRILEVLSLDVMCLRAAKRALESLGALGAQQQLGFVVNRAARGEITSHDVERVFGARPLAVFGNEPAVSRAQDHGSLLPARGRMARAFDRLAAEVLPQPPA
jgi:pilus assembly protein CpaE